MYGGMGGMVIHIKALLVRMCIYIASCIIAQYCMQSYNVLCIGMVTSQFHVFHWISILLQ